MLFSRKGKSVLFQRVLWESLGQEYSSRSIVDLGYFGRKTCLGDPGRADYPEDNFSGAVWTISAEIINPISVWLQALRCSFDPHCL